MGWDRYSTAVRIYTIRTTTKQKSHFTVCADVKYRQFALNNLNSMLCDSYEIVTTNAASIRHNKGAV